MYYSVVYSIPPFFPEPPTISHILQFLPIPDPLPECHLIPQFQQRDWIQICCSLRKKRQIFSFFRLQDGLIEYDGPTQEDSSTHFAYNTRVNSDSFSFVVFCFTGKASSDKGNAYCCPQIYYKPSMLAMERIEKVINNKSYGWPFYLESKRIWQSITCHSFLHNGVGNLQCYHKKRGRVGFSLWIFRKVYIS